MTQQSDIHNFVEYLLGDIKQQPTSSYITQWSSQNTGGSNFTNAENYSIKDRKKSILFGSSENLSMTDSADYSPAQYLTITGTTEVTISDEDGNTASIENGLTTRTDATAMPMVAAPPAPTGTRNVTINNAGQSIGDFAALKNLTLNGNIGQ